MLENISILLPYGPDNGPRDIAFSWIKEFYKVVMPEAEICVGQLENNKRFSKSKAVNLAARMATRDIFVIADGDIIYDPDVLEKSVKALEEYTWILPVERALDVSKESTENLLGTCPCWPLSTKLETSERCQVGVGLLNVLRREHFEAVGGFDERFFGWGGEDDAFSISMSMVCGGSHRLDCEVYHLWHADRDYSNYSNNCELLGQYCKGREAIEKLIEERKA